MENMIKLEAPGEITFLGLFFVYIMLPGLRLESKIRCCITTDDDIK
jgi:hypothetical protein